MAKFFVGQKVRIVRGWDSPFDKGPSPKGKEAMIVEGPRIFIGRVMEYTWRAYVLDDEKTILGNDCDFEPLQKDDGRQIVAWKECPWMPEHLREIA